VRLCREGFNAVSERVGAPVALDSDGIDAPYAVVQIAGIVLRNHESADAGCGRGGTGVVAVVVGVKRRGVVDARIRRDDACDGRDIGITLRRRGLYVRGRVENGLIGDRTREYQRRRRRSCVVLIHPGTRTEGVVPGEDFREFGHRRCEQAFEVEVLMCCVLRTGRRLRAGESGAEKEKEGEKELQDWTHKVGGRPPGIGRTRKKDRAPTS
jgi:hypothetical protein